MMFVVMAIADLAAGDPKGTGIGVLSALLVFFGGLSALFGWLAYALGLRKSPENRQELERQVLNLAKIHGGVLTPALLAAETELSLQASQELLEAFVAQSVAYMEIQDDGAIHYAFAGLLET